MDSTASQTSLPKPSLPLPAYDTKHELLLTYHIANRTYHISQSQDSGATGSTLWLSAQILCEYLVDVFGDHGSGKNKRQLRKTNKADKSKPTVLELGSGTGLTALVVRELGFQVTATDIPSVSEDYLRPNIEKNTRTGHEDEITIIGLDWKGPNDAGTVYAASKYHPEYDPERADQTPTSVPSTEYDFVMGSDLVYEDSMVAPLCGTLSRFVGGRTTVYLAQEVRVQSLFDNFVKECEAHGLKGAKVPDEELCKILRNRGWDDVVWEGVEVWKFRRKSKGKLSE